MKSGQAPFSVIDKGKKTNRTTPSQDIKKGWLDAGYITIAQIKKIKGALYILWY